MPEPLKGSAIERTTARLIGEEEIDEMTGQTVLDDDEEEEDDDDDE